MKRARERHVGLTISETVDRVGRYMLTSSAAISRLESLDDPPTGRRARALAAALVYIYGLDPRPFGVGRDDLPPAIYADLVAAGPSSAWVTADELRRPLVAA
jgi:hypothetical protein